MSIGVYLGCPMNPREGLRSLFRGFGAFNFSTRDKAVAYAKGGVAASNKAINASPSGSVLRVAWGATKLGYEQALKLASAAKPDPLAVQIKIRQADAAADQAKKLSSSPAAKKSVTSAARNVASQALPEIVNPFDEVAATPTPKVSSSPRPPGEPALATEDQGTIATPSDRPRRSGMDQVTDFVDKYKVHLGIGAGGLLLAGVVWKLLGSKSRMAVAPALTGYSKRRRRR